MSGQAHCFQVPPATAADVARAFEEFSGQRSLSGEVVSAAQVALDEVVSNVVKAGFAPGEQGIIDVSFDVGQGALEIVVRDNGRPFNPLSRPDPDTRLPLEDRPVGGLGIYLVKTLMSRVEYERAGDRNVLRMTKRMTG